MHWEKQLVNGGKLVVPVTKQNAHNLPIIFSNGCLQQARDDSVTNNINAWNLATVSSSNETYLIYKIAEMFLALIFRETKVPVYNQQ